MRAKRSTLGMVVVHEIKKVPIVRNDEQGSGGDREIDVMCVVGIAGVREGLGRGIGKRGNIEQFLEESLDPLRRTCLKR